MMMKGEEVCVIKGEGCERCEYDEGCEGIRECVKGVSMMKVVRG